MNKRLKGFWNRGKSVEGKPLRMEVMMNHNLNLRLILIFFFSGILFGQSIEDKCKYYPLHIGDEWHYEITDYEEGSEPIISFSDRYVIGDTVLQNGFTYFVINEDGYLVFERIDSVNLKVMKYEKNSCQNDEKDIYSLDFNPDMQIQWIDCSGRAWDVNYLSSGGIEDSSYIRLYSDWLDTRENHLDKGWGLRYSFTGEINAVYKNLTSAIVSGRVWGTSGMSNKELIAKKIKLFQNFPNPFNPVTNIFFSIPTKSNVSLYIFDLSGKIIETVEMNNLLPGTHSYKWNGEKFASGIYFYKIKINDYIQTRKMILLK